MLVEKIIFFILIILYIPFLHWFLGLLMVYINMKKTSESKSFLNNKGIDSIIMSDRLYRKMLRELTEFSEYLKTN